MSKFSAALAASALVLPALAHAVEVITCNGNGVQVTAHPGRLYSKVVVRSALTSPLGGWHAEIAKSPTVFGPLGSKPIHVLYTFGISDANGVNTITVELTGETGTFPRYGTGTILVGKAFARMGCVIDRTN